MAVSVLLVEDDTTLANAIARNLAATGYNVRTATTVSQAVAALKEGFPTLALLDINLPDGDGWEVLRDLRRRPGRPVPVIVMSVLRVSESDVDEPGVVAVLEKPFPLESILRLVSSFSCGLPNHRTCKEGEPG